MTESLNVLPAFAEECTFNGLKQAERLAAGVMEAFLMFDPFAPRVTSRRRDILVRRSVKPKIATELMFSGQRLARRKLLRLVVAQP